MLVIREKRSKFNRTMDMVYWSGMSFLAGALTMLCVMVWFMRG